MGSVQRPFTDRQLAKRSKECLREGIILSLHLVPCPLHLRPVPVFLPCHLSITCHCVKRACAIQAALTPHLGHCLSHIASIGPIFHPVGSVRCHLPWPAWCTAWNEIWEQLALNLDCNLTSRASSFRSGEAVRCLATGGGRTQFFLLTFEMT